VQSFLTGTEYIVDTVSVDGTPRLRRVQYDKRLLAQRQGRSTTATS